jgi:hypothetical protein
MVNTFEIDLDLVASVNVTFAVTLVSDLSLKLVLIVCVPPSLWAVKPVGNDVVFSNVPLGEKTAITAFIT